MKSTEVNVYTYKCKDGYKINGPEKRTCNTVDGTFDPAEQPTCDGMCIRLNRTRGHI